MTNATAVKGAADCMACRLLYSLRRAEAKFPVDFASVALAVPGALDCATNSSALISFQPGVLCALGGESKPAPHLAWTNAVTERAWEVPLR